MFKKILIANRSEIAVRIIKAAREMGINTVAVYSEVDSNALHVQLADESYCIGQAPAAQSYLDMDKIIETAKESGCDGIHPGYGFMAENTVFAQKCIDNNITFIGPKPDVINLLGSKVESRKAMLKADVPVIPGMKGSSNNVEEFRRMALEVGYPVLIKASAGGGGKGMRRVDTADELHEAISGAMREAKSAFGDDAVFLEKYIEKPRHIEFQIAADLTGECVHLFERECSIQRRHQKVIEETPSVALDNALRNKMGETAVRVAKTVGYSNVGTVEFLVDKDSNFYFLEVNTRIQVEHPVTELTTGVDLLKTQIELAAGMPLPFSQSDLKQFGHAIECRLYAEDSKNNFLPSSGTILKLEEPKGPWIRVDSGIFEGAEVSVFYDPILSKLIVWAKDRDEAILKMIRALKDYVILGIETPIQFLIDVLEHPEFKSGNTFTDFIQKHNMLEITHDNADIDDISIAIAAFFAYKNEKAGSNAIGVVSNNADSPWNTVGKWEVGK